MTLFLSPRGYFAAALAPMLALAVCACGGSGPEAGFRAAVPPPPPGPGFAALAIAPGSAAIFVIALLVGMLAVRLVEGQG